MDRQTAIFKAIVKHFIQTAEPVGSNTLFVSYSFKVSPATIRNDMAALEEKGYIYQPHTSAGRIPTNLGFQHYAHELVDYEGVRKKAVADLKNILQEYKIQKTRERIFDAVSLLARASGNVSFATLPDNPRTFFLGLGNVLKQREFRENSIQASEVVEVLEKNDHFVNTLKQLGVNDTIKVFVGDENILPQIQSCAVIVTRYNIEGYDGFFGLLGPIRMNYEYNIVMTEEIKKLLET